MIVDALRLVDCVGKQVRVTTRNTIYVFDVFAADDIHGEALANGREPRYLTERTSDVKINGTKMIDLPWDYLTGDYAQHKREGEIVTDGYLRFIYPGQYDPVNSSKISCVDVVDLPINASRVAGPVSQDPEISRNESL